MHHFEAFTRVVAIQVVSYTGGYDSAENHVKNVLSLDMENVHCSSEGRNWDLLLRCKLTEGVTVTNVVVKGPSDCTAPIKHAAFWFWETQPDVGA